MQTSTMYRWLAALVTSGSLCLVGGCDSEEPLCGAWAPGDVVLGLLMPSHRTAQGRLERVRPEMLSCTEFDLVAFVRSLAAIHVIEEINAAGVLPGVRLGYVMCDTCADPTKALQNVVHMLATNNSLNVQCDLTHFRPPVKAILGARYSEVSIAVARLLSVYMVPQISETSSSPALSDKLRYPAFLRTIPSDIHQTKALAKLMTQFGWTWVGVVYGDDDYGKGAFQSFVRDAGEASVCLAFQETLPHDLTHKDSAHLIKRVAREVRSSTARVVLLILKSELVAYLFSEMIVTSTSRIWIASDSWSVSRLLANLDGIDKVGDIFGFAFISQETESFSHYLKNLRPSPRGYNRFIEKYKNLRFNCTPECFSDDPPFYCVEDNLLTVKSPDACAYKDPQEANDDFLVTSLDTHQPRGGVAVWAVANALKKLLNCNSTSCSGDTNFEPWRLLEELKKGDFQLDNNTYFFDKSGDFVTGYDLFMWEKAGDRRNFAKIGWYRVLDGKIVLDVEATEINWLSSVNKSIPTSRCSEPCMPGTVKKISNISCCYSCTPCLEGTFTDGLDLNDCKKCPEGTWSLKGWVHCKPRTEVYLRWSEPHPIALVAAAAFGMLLLQATLIIFLMYRNSQPMKKAEVRLSCVMMAGLALSFASVILFMDKPNIHLCRARQVMYAVGFTLCVSCILIKAFRTFLAFLPFGQLRCRRLRRLYKPPVNVTVVILLQGVICALWLIFDSPDVDLTPPSPQSMEKIIRCHEGITHIGFAVMHSYIALLALIGFLLAFKGRKVPQEFSETGYIIFSMLMYLFVWVCFIPIYIFKTKESSYVQASAILVSSYGIVFCHFLPKCYEALWGSNQDTLEVILRKWRIISSGGSSLGDAARFGEVLQPESTDTQKNKSHSHDLDSPVEPQMFVIPITTEAIDRRPQPLTPFIKMRNRLRSLSV